MPVITNRIKNFLTESMRLYEFNHTVLHKQVNILILKLHKSFFYFCHKNINIEFC